MSDKKKYSFKCLEQNCPQRVCCTRPHVNVTLSDLSRWTLQNYLSHILPGVTLNMNNNENAEMSLETLRQTLSEGEQETACVFFDKDANACRIRFSRPIACRTFPLQYDGEKYFVTNKDCAGIGGGEVTREALREAKELAETEYKERMETVTALPAIYSVIMGQMLRQSAEAMKTLSDEDRKKLDEIMSKERQAQSDE